MARALRKGDRTPTQVLVLVSGADPRRPRVAQRPVRRLLPDAVPPVGVGGPPEAPFWHQGGGPAPELVSYGELVLNLETYQATIDGAPLDLTYMEYELLKFLSQNPGKVFTRETLLSGCGATSTTAEPAPSTSTSAAYAPSSARNTPT